MNDEIAMHPICIEARAQADRLDRIGLTDSAPLLRRMADEVERLDKLASAISRDCNNTALERNTLQRRLSAEYRRSEIEARKLDEAEGQVHALTAERALYKGQAELNRDTIKAMQHDLSRAIANHAADLTAEPPSASPWISVNDRLPIGGTEVLYVFNGQWWPGKYLGCDNEDSLPCFGGNYGFLTGDVTHWMPIPSLPGAPVTKEPYLAKQIAQAQRHIAETPAYALGVAKNCPKCGGAGWLRGSELDNPSEDTYADSMTRYSCDVEKCTD